MMASTPARHLLLGALLLVTACGEGKKPQAPERADVGVTQPATPPATSPVTPAATPGNSADNPLLRKPAVQQAIYRALKTGENQRWQDGELSGYAVPSVETLANGCRTVRYTVDQRPDDPLMTINACDAK